MLVMYLATLIVDRRIHGKRPDGHPCHKLLPLDVEKEKGMKIEIMQCSPLANSLGYSLIRATDLDSTHPDFAEKVNAFKCDYGEATAVRITKSLSMIMVLNNNCTMANIVSESACFLLSAIPRDDNIIEWRVLGPNNVIINRLLARMKAEGFGVEKISSNRIEVTSTLSDKQEEHIHLAYRMGYYDVPRRISLEQLAQAAHCSKSTLSVALRDAERRLIMHHIMTNLYNMKYG